MDTRQRRRRAMDPKTLIELYNAGNRNFNRANLHGADLHRANLHRANLHGANLHGADLREADLGRANLGRANLSGANLSGANLSGADLENLEINHNTNFSKTILSKTDSVHIVTTKEILNAGMEIEGDFVIGYRTSVSKKIEPQVRYTPGSILTAPYFSLDRNTNCHPGLYIASERWLTCANYDKPYVRVCCRRDELIHAGDKWRAKRLMVLPYKD
jgi:hypothetical protein